MRSGFVNSSRVTGWLMPGSRAVCPTMIADEVLEVSANYDSHLAGRVRRRRLGQVSRRSEVAMSGGDVGSVEGLGLADAIGLLRDELLRARAAGATSEIQLPVESMTVELTVTATRSVDGRAGFKVPFVQFELGGGGSRQRGSEQLVTVVFGGPVDRQGRPVKVAQATDELKG
jgi:Trypsin-co-occurring domain 2